MLIIYSSVSYRKGNPIFVKFFHFEMDGAEIIYHNVFYFDHIF